MKLLSVILLLSFLIASCGNDSAEQPMPADGYEVIASAQDLFFSNLSDLCDERFTGSSTYPDDDDHALVNTELNVHIRSCEEDRIEVDLFRDGDTWHATWVLTMQDDGLHLYHDHIGDKDYPEGEEPLTGYGGFASDSGTGTMQLFPADSHTAQILPEAATNVWMMHMDLEEGRFIYYLERHDAPRFRAELTHVN